METAGALAIFKPSGEKNKLQCTSYLGDGDTSAFISVQEAQIFK